jgi:hypothetical protein
MYLLPHSTRGKTVFSAIPMIVTYFLGESLGKAITIDGTQFSQIGL